jgi:hypothetical protein
MSLSIVVDRESLELAPSGNVVGNVYALFDNTAFPDAGWWRFPCLVVGAWWRRLQQLEEGVASLRFMDGPASIQCERAAGFAGDLIEEPVRPGSSPGSA